MAKQEKIPVEAEKAIAYDSTINIFEGLFREIKEMSKKKPEATLSKFKVGQLNRLLNDLKEFLDEEPEGKYLDLFDDDSLPQMGDAVLVMAQYEAALMGFRRRHYDISGLNDFWVIKKQASGKRQ